MEVEIAASFPYQVRRRAIDILKLSVQFEAGYVDRRVFMLDVN